MKKYSLYLIVFISGGAILAIEILGSRILGPFYGVSIFLWSALIGVTLIALSLGYFLGGKLADKTANINILSIILIFSGLLTLLMPLIKSPIIILTEPWGLRISVLFSSLLLFAPPLTLLGMVSPYAIKLKTQSLKEVGTSAGNLYAISTIGSVFSALLVGFYLIPNIGVIKLIFAIGSILILLGAFIFVTKKSIKSTMTILFVVFILLINFFIKSEEMNKDEENLVIKQSPYGEIRVIDYDNDRFLLIDGAVHTVVDTQTWQSSFPYVAVIDLAKNILNCNGELLLIGLGGGTIAKNFFNDGWNVDAVEIDPIVEEMAYKYFGLKKEECKVFNDDGRQFLKRTNLYYDLIILDAFGSSSIPFHLITKEVFGLISNRLNSKGIFMLNVESIGWNDIIVKSISATLKSIFKNIIVLPIVEPPNALGNIIITASNNEINLISEIEENHFDSNFRYSSSYYQNHAWNNRFDPDISNAKIITDDLNPVDLWSERINLVSRNNLHEYFKNIDLGW